MFKRFIRERTGLELSEYALAAALMSIVMIFAFRLVGGTIGNGSKGSGFVITALTLLIPLAGIISYHDVRYRRIPNAFVLATLASGILINVAGNGVSGLWSSLAGCALAFALMFILHVIGSMGAGDVKLFAAIGSVVGLNLVLPFYVVTLITGGALALITILRAGTFCLTMRKVLQIFAGLIPGWRMPRFNVPSDRRLTIPYGVAIVLGSIISLFIYRV